MTDRPLLALAPLAQRAVRNLAETATLAERLGVSVGGPHEPYRWHNPDNEILDGLPVEDLRLVHRAVVDALDAWLYETVDGPIDGTTGHHLGLFLDRISAAGYRIVPITEGTA